MTRTKIAVRTLPLLIAGLFSGSAMAAGFQLMEQNASGLGSAYSGTAAVAEDASTVFFNPAGMTYLPGIQAVIAGSLIKPQATFNNDGSTAGSPLNPLGSANGGDAGDLAFVPATYFTMQLTPSLGLGLGINAPFGLKTEYDSNWIGRYHAIKSDVKTININPSIAYKINDQISIGAGLNFQRLDAELTSAVAYSTIIAAGSRNAILVPGLEGTSKVKGDDTGWGYNLGAIFQVSPSTRLGAAYRSKIKYNVTGDVTFDRPTSANPTANAIMAGATPNGPIKLDIELPDVATFSVHQKLSDQWEMMGDVSWTGWAKIPRLSIYRTNGTLLSNTEENWRNTVRVAFGGAYKYSDALKLRAGVAYDQTPVEDDFRTPRLPDMDRYWLSFGGQYKVSAAGAIDFGYTHIFIKNGTIRDNSGGGQSQALQGFLIGNYNSNSVDILAVQYTHKF